MTQTNAKSLKLLVFPGRELRQNAATGKTAPVLCIGNFDGAHLGHAALAQDARQLAANQGANVLALSFAPHPRRFFKPDAPFFQLTPPALRHERLAAIGFDGLAELAFDGELANMSAEDFVRDILVGALNASGVVVGTDFHFGKDRRGTPDYLAEAGGKHGFATGFVPALRDKNGEIISSTAIRNALAEGNLDRANRMLGYGFEIVGEVIHGAKRGRELGYPTANIALEPGCALKHGIYAVRVLIDGAPLKGVASFGRRPMFDNGAPLLEVFVLDFAGDLYGKTLRVSFEAFLRGEEKFPSLEALIVQMDADRDEARRLLSEQ
ncbi:MAG: bifunctional riboflavin kinase/FAD synthetase [Rhabdaerophilum sp.]